MAGIVCYVSQTLVFLHVDRSHVYVDFISSINDKKNNRLKHSTKKIRLRIDSIINKRTINLKHSIV